MFAFHYKYLYFQQQNISIPPPMIYGLVHLFKSLVLYANALFTSTFLYTHLNHWYMHYLPPLFWMERCLIADACPHLLQMTSSSAWELEDGPGLSPFHSCCNPPLAKRNSFSSYFISIFYNESFWCSVLSWYANNHLTSTLTSIHTCTCSSTCVRPIKINQ